MFAQVGEFQCYDRRAMASLARCAQEAGHPEWGYTGPTGVGDYNTLPMDTAFFSWNGGWQTPQGHFFLTWYSGHLRSHARRMLAAAVTVFFPHMHADAQAQLRARGAFPLDDLLPQSPSLRVRSPPLLHISRVSLVALPWLSHVVDLLAGAINGSTSDPGSRACHVCSTGRSESRSV